jgi:hypothetical protein
MGNTKSFEENLNEKKGELNSQHSDLDLMISRINAEADRLIALILERKYNDRDEICKKLGYQKVDELSKFFEIQTLEGVRYRLGIVPPNTPQLEENKQKVCLDIVNFYLKKLNLIGNIQKELPNCRNMEKEIMDNLEDKLRSNRLNNAEWLAIYDKLEKFNKEIKSRYSLIERELERIRLAKTMPELDLIARTTNSILSNTDKICRNYENELFQYSNRAEQYRRREQSTVRNLEQDMQAGSPRAQYDLQNISTEINQENAFESSPTTFAPSPSPEQYASRTRRMDDLQMERNRRLQETQRLPTISLTSPIPSSSPRVVHTVVEEYPVVRRTVRKPVVVREEIVESGEPISPAPLKTPKQKLAEIPVETFPESRLQRSGQKTISVRAEKIERRDDTLHIRNPTKFEVTRTVPREQVVKPRQGTKIIRVEPVYSQKNVNNPMGIPVRAVREHVPRSPGEVPLREGQPTIYLGTGENGWSRVRHADGTEGYVPHTYLSK